MSRSLNVMLYLSRGVIQITVEFSLLLFPASDLGYGSTGRSSIRCPLMGEHKCLTKYRALVNMVVAFARSV